LYVDFDFDLAQKKLVQVETVLKCDFFLASLADEFVECARHLISEAYCRIHQVIDIKYHAVESEADYRDLSRRLNLSPEEGEKWIVSLIRDNRSDAKIDFNKVTAHLDSVLTAGHRHYESPTAIRIPTSYRADKGSLLGFNSHGSVDQNSSSTCGFSINISRQRLVDETIHSNPLKLHQTYKCRPKYPSVFPP
jgi:hypothetical protein